MYLFGIKHRKLEKSSNDALRGVNCCYWTDTEERKEYNRTKQRMFDEKVVRGIKREAERMLQEWINAPVLKLGDKEFKNCIQTMRPFIYAYEISDEETAKFLNTDISELVCEEYNKLKSNYYT